MPLLDRQRRGRQIGEIRLGITVTARSGKQVPEKLDTFRFTTRSGRVAHAVSALLGGRVEQTELRNGKRTYEVVTTVSEVPVMVPPGDAMISQ
jgi:Recombination directionality factor-like